MGQLKHRLRRLESGNGAETYTLTVLLVGDDWAQVHGQKEPLIRRKDESSEDFEERINLLLPGKHRATKEKPRQYVEIGGDDPSAYTYQGQ